MADQADFTITFKTVADALGITQMVDSLGKINEKVGQASQASASFGAALAGAVGGATVAIVQQVGAALEEIPRRLVEGIAEGIRFNVELQNLQTSMAGILRLTQSDQFGSFAEAKAAAIQYTETLKEAANKVGVSYAQMFETVREAQARLSGAGITDINQVIKTALLLDQAMKAVGVSSQSASRDVGDLLLGNAQTLGGRALAASLHLSTAELGNLTLQAVQSGNAAEHLAQIFGSLQEAIDDSSHNFESDLARMRNVVTDLESEAAKPIMKPLQDGITGTIAPKNVEGLKSIAGAIGTIAAAAVTAANEVGKFGKEIATLAAFIPGIGQAVAGAKEVVDFFSKSGSASGPGSTPVQVGNTQKVVELTKEQSAMVEKTNQEADLLAARLEGNAEKVAEIVSDAAYDKAIDAARKLGPLTLEQVNAAERLREVTYQSVLAQQNRASSATADNAEEKDATDALTNAKFILTSAEQTYQQKILQTELLEKSGDISAQEANARKAQAAREYIATLEELKQRLPELIALFESLGDTKQLDEVKLQLQEIDNTILQVKIDTEQTDFFGGLKRSFNDFFNTIAPTGQRIGQQLTATLGGAINGISNGITGAIFKTQTWGQAWLQIGQAAVSQLIQMGVQTAVYYAGLFAKWAIAKALSSTYRAADTAEHVSQEGIKAAAAAPSALLTSISSYGAAAVIGLAAVIAAVAAFAFAEGGVVEAGTHGTADDVPAWLSKGEGILTARTVERHGGPGFVHALNSGAFYQAPQYQGGGVADSASPATGFGASGGGTAAPRVHVYVVSNPVEAQRIALNDPEGIHQLVDALRGVSYMLPKT